MRITRIVSAFVALVLAVTLSGLVATPAQAAKPKHDLKITDAGEIGQTSRFFVKGKVSTFIKKKVILQRQVSKGAPFKLYKKDKTNDKGKFSMTFDGPVGSCFKIVVPKTSSYKATKKKIGCIVKS